MPGRKRKAAPADAVSTPAAASSSSRRRSQRITSTSAAKTSKYFEPEVSDSEPESGVKPRRRKSSGGSSKKTTAKKARLEIDEDEDDYDDDDEKKQEYDDDEQEASDSELDEDAPPKVTFIPLPKLRDTGGIDYADDRLHPNTLAFLKDLKANNVRSWLKTHDQEFRRSLKDWESYVMTMTDKVIAADETIPELPFKDVNFRIYRDIRFSHDPTPYKPNFGAAWSRTGRKGPYACYYLHLEPGGKCFVGGGLWHPPADALAKVRASIDERPRRWRRVLMDPDFRDMFLQTPKKSTAKSATSGKRKVPRGKGSATATSSAPASTSTPGKKGRGRPRKSTTVVETTLAEPEEDEQDEPQEIHGTDNDDNDEKAVIRAFVQHNKEDALKTKPKGYIAEHRDIELLKLRSFTVGKKIPDEMFTRDSKNGQEEIARIFKAMVGFVTHLNRIVMPDPGDDDDDSDDE